jgi:hypothetical protein
MLHDEDLDAAVAAGIVTQAQLDALRAFAIRRQPRSAVERADDERFRFLRGFNDVFFAVGIALVGVGSSLFAGSGMVGNLVAALVMWILAELVVRRMRLVLPGIVLACFFVFFVFRAVELDWTWLALTGSSLITGRSMWWLVGGPSGPAAVALAALLCALAALAFYFRFRLPFALLLIAGSLVVVAVAAFEHIWPGSIAHSHALVLLPCGVAVFAVAMAYDFSDPDRVTRRSDCAFWLHLMAAPLMVHSLIVLVAGTTLTRTSLTSHLAGAIVLVILVLTLVAVSIDRRALFVSALSYLGIVIGYAITGATGYQPADGSLVAAATLSVLGAMVLMLGIGWRPLRRLVVRCFPGGIMRRLPPLAPAA